MIRRRSTAAGLAAGVVWPHATQAREDRLTKVRRTGILRVGAVNGQPPYSWKDLATGNWSGFMIDVATGLAGELGAQVEPVESTWGNAVLDVQADKVDVFFGLAPTPQRRLAVDFTQPLYDNAFALVARHGFDPALWQQVNDPSVRVALEFGTVYDQNVPTLCPNATVIRLKTNNEALLTVQSGRADCQMLVVILALVTLARNPAAGHLIVPEPVFASPTAAIVAKDPDGTWLDREYAWIGRLRAARDLRRMLVANLEKSGVRGSDVPAQLLF